jgi:hypothetical protein
MRRYSFWRTALFDYVHAVSARQFQWGQHDCALFAAGAVQAMTGEDFASKYRGRYKTLKGGFGLLKKAGFANHADMAASLLEEVHPSLAQVGDVAAIEENGAIGLGIVQGERIYVLRPGTAGIGTVSRLEAMRAFRVPFGN